MSMYTCAAGCIGVSADVPQPDPSHGTHGTHYLWENGKSGFFSQVLTGIYVWLLVCTVILCLGPVT